MAYLDRTTPPHITTLVMATAAGTLAINIFLPSLPGMARYFATDYAFAQLAVSIYLAFTGVLQLFIGPASDRFGRRPVMLFCLAVFLLGTLGALYAPTIEILLGCRILQAFSAVGMVVSRAVVRDTVTMDEAASRIGYITMGMAIVPMIGPTIGGLLDEMYGWQASFVLMFAFGLIAFVIVFLDQGETNRLRSASFSAQFRNYPALLRLPRFWAYSLTAAFTSGTFFSFVGGGPFVATEILGLSPSGYGIYFGIISAGYLIGNFLSGRFSSRTGVNRMVLGGNLVAAVGILLSLAFFSLGFYHPLSLFGPVVFVGIGNGMTLPNANAGIVNSRPDLAGSASGLGGALQVAGGALFSVIGGAVLSPDSGPNPLLFVMLGACALALCTTFWLLRLGETGADD